MSLSFLCEYSIEFNLLVSTILVVCFAIAFSTGSVAGFQKILLLSLGSVYALQALAFILDQSKLAPLVGLLLPCAQVCTR
jgi:hypothetical protein